MPLIRKRRIWWEPVPEASDYVVYVSKDSKMSDPSKFAWENTPGIICKTVLGKTELIIPDEWPEFPADPGIYYIAVTSRDSVGNQSDPFLASGHFKFAAPPPPPKGGIESLSLVHLESGIQAPSMPRQGRAIIQEGLEEVRNNKEVQHAYLSVK